MSRKIFKWLNKDGILLMLAIILFIYIIIHFLFANHFRTDISLEEKIIVGIGLIGSLLWIRIEAALLSQPTWQDLIDDYKIQEVIRNYDLETSIAKDKFAKDRN